MTISIRLAQPDEGETLCHIEDEAMAAFATVGLHELSKKITSRGLFDEAIAAKRAWVAEDAGDIIGFLAADILDGNAYLKEVDVLPANQDKGVGRTLVERFLA